MKEDFLHYVWKFKKFRISELQTASGEQLTIVNTGQYLELAGPDFFNGQIVINGQKWAGNIEIHLKSSDWYLHNHESDPAYENVILHVVWEHDADVYRTNNTIIPVLILRDFVDSQLLQQYQNLTVPKSWIFCERHIKDIDHFILRNWMGRLFFERLERKCLPIVQLLATTGNDWEAVLFYSLAKGFGLNDNGECFYAAAQLIPFAVIRKECRDLLNIESLLFGNCGLLSADYQDQYPNNLWVRYSYLLRKYNLPRGHHGQVNFFKHRPDNFPTLRLSQFAMLYHQKTNLFDDLIAAKKTSEIYRLFAVSVSAYWETHYQFDKPSPAKKKPLSKSFVDLMIINTIIPVRFAYDKSRGVENHDTLVGLLADLAPERNAIIDKFSRFGIQALSAFETQALIQLKNEYCNLGKCTRCAIGAELLKSRITD